MFGRFDNACANLVDEAIGIATALEGAIQYETVFNCTSFERSRMINYIERRNEALKKK